MLCVPIGAEGETRASCNSCKPEGSVLGGSALSILCVFLMLSHTPSGSIISICLGWIPMLSTSGRWLGKVPGVSLQSGADPSHCGG